MPITLAAALASLSTISGGVSSSTQMVVIESGAGKLATKTQFESAAALGLAVSDETTALTTGVGKLTIRSPYGFTLTEVRASVKTASSSGVVTVDINKNGSTILSTKLTIDASEKTSTTAATPAVISGATIANDDELSFDIDTAGTGAVGLKVWLIGTRT
jgi:hypothetical protein